MDDVRLARLSFRALRDSREGVLILDAQGNISYVNAALGTMLGIPQIHTLNSYAEIMAQAPAPENDDFFQVLVDGARNLNGLVKREVGYINPQGEKSYLILSLTVLRNDTEQNDGAVFNISDITSEVQHKRQIWNLFICCLCYITMVCTWNFCTEAYNALGHPFPMPIMSWTLIGLSLLSQICYYIFGYIDKPTFGLSLRNIWHNLGVGVLVTVFFLMLLMGIKYYLLKYSPNFFPDSKQFFNWEHMRSWENIVYPFSVFLQELVLRGMIHENLYSSLPDSKIRGMVSIMVTALGIGAIHIHIGWVYMVGSVIVLGLEGILYVRQRSIWGLCLIHLILGWALSILSFA